MAGSLTVVKKTRKIGRPSLYSQELADEICEHLAMGESIRTVCKPDGMPSIQTFFSWLKKYPDFLEQYTRAKEEAADAMAEDILDIADNSTNDWIEQNGDEDAKERYSLNGENIQRARLRVESRKWLMAKMKPKKYGDKVDLTTNGKDLPTPILGQIPTSNTIRDVMEGEIVSDTKEITKGSILDSIDN